MKKLLILLIPSLFLAFSAPTAKRKLMADKAATTVTYAMRHPMHEWEGVSREVACAIVYDDATQRIENVAAAVKVSSFDSGNSNRDSHALESLEALKYPNVTFVSQDIQPGPNGALTIRGNLTFHNVTKPIVVQATRKDGNGRITVEGKFNLTLTDYKIERPSLMMIPVEDDLRMTFSFVFRTGGV